ncbi:DUF2510 domain-containing protein [Mycolicibacterium pallens]|uniref:DUF2510 domain-containing protein n=1 Tax=Mycolicibacterium pallens TaxID=370524 RepID=A0ABX8VCY1_9MYCO|nr:DUF2510 domain-containing protein [Mycolicibacterium pallens]QYL14943.1 DUF2510 domain-containing protein [Mycolicibacterium pallens]
MGELQAGWYPDPHDQAAEVYWTGTQWDGRRAKLSSAQPPSPATGEKPNKKRVWLIAGLILGAVIISQIVWTCASYRPYEKECRDAGVRHGLQGQQLEQMVESCERLREQGYK